AHDLRAPLRAMAGFSQILAQEYSGKPFDQTGQEYALRIEKGAQEMDTLIQELLAYCRIAHANIELVKVDPASVIDEILKRKTQLLTEKCDIHVSDSFPPILGDRKLLEHVISNLVSNAAKFTKPGVQAKIRIRPEGREERVRLWIEDDGIGIPPQHHDRIFRTFERLN